MQMEELLYNERQMRQAKRTAYLDGRRAEHRHISETGGLLYSQHQTEEANLASYRHGREDEYRKQFAPVFVNGHCITGHLPVTTRTSRTTTVRSVCVRCGSTVTWERSDESKVEE